MLFPPFTFARSTVLKIIFLLVCFISVAAGAQQDRLEQKRIYFPHPLSKNWEVSVGFIATTLIHEITEEVRFRVPAADLHVLKNINGEWYIDGRLNFQFFQNMVSVGPRWSKKLGEKVSMALGNDLAFWMGFFNQQGFKTRGSGWLNSPNISFGYKFNKEILLTLRAESLMTFGKKSFADETRISREYDLFNGSAYSIFLEQPFFAGKSITLGFRAIYTNFLWQTWTLFANYDRNLFYPQLIVGIIL
ncbi:MAG: hypothetical protein H0U44_07210 [Flavisolibacter sp.]|jgi:hypothetical protein|nr:hypothetical protein [Flavisolibacter sp.]